MTKVKQSFEDLNHESLYFCRLGFEQADSEEYKSSIISFKKAIDIDPTYKSTFLYYEGVKSFGVDKFVEAIEDSKKAILEKANLNTIADNIMFLKEHATVLEIQNSFLFLKDNKNDNKALSALECFDKYNEEIVKPFEEQIKTTAQYNTYKNAKKEAGKQYCGKYYQYYNDNGDCDDNGENDSYDMFGVGLFGDISNKEVEVKQIGEETHVMKEYEQ